MSNTPIYTLIDRWLNGVCTNEEKEQLKAYFLQYGLTEEKLVDDPLYHPNKDQSEQIYARLKEKLNIPAETIRMHTNRTWVLRIAAAVIPLMIMTAVFYFGNRHPQKNEHAVTASLKQIRNTGKDPRHIQLPDGSQIWLNNNTSLSLDTVTFAQHRNIILEGEAYFDVAHDPAHPFTVSTGNVRTRVLGTAFNIEAYKQESEIRVSLVRGKVAMDDTATGQTTLLAPNQAVRYDKRSQSWEVLPVNAANIDLWTHGYLVFKEVPLQEVIARIAGKYNITIESDPALVQHKRITAAFPGDAWPSVLANILFVHDLKYQKAGEKFVITKATQ